MRMITAVVLFVVVLASAGAVSHTQDSGAAAPQPQPNQQWLKQLVGEWDVKSKMYMEPGAAPMEAAGVDTVRAVGEYFVIAEVNSTMMGMPFTGVMTLGYIEAEGKYAGTWIDSMTSHLWVYEGAVNEAGDALVLRTEGPSMEAPGATAKYKETIAIKDKDHRTFSSVVQLSSGEWMTILTAEYSRKK